jgi:hypothetical protein
MNQLGRKSEPPLRVLLNKIFPTSAPREYAIGVAVGGRGLGGDVALGVNVGASVGGGGGVKVRVGDGGRGKGVPPITTVTPGVTP